MAERTVMGTNQGATDAPAEPGPDALPAGVPIAVEKATATKTAVTAPELFRSDAGDVEAAMITMERSGAEQVTAQRVVMDRSGARRLETRSAQLDRSGVVSLTSEHTVLQGGSAISVSAREARLVKSRALLLVSGQTTVEPGSRVLVHLGRWTGDGRPAVTGTGAAAFGAALGVVVLVVGSLLRRLGRRG